MSGTMNMLSIVNRLATSKSDGHVASGVERVKMASPLAVPLSLLLISSVDFPNV